MDECIHRLYNPDNAEGSDYESTTQEITFSQGEQFKTVEVPVIDDGVFENTEEFSAQLTTTDIRVNIVERDATARIADNDDGNAYRNIIIYIIILYVWTDLLLMFHLQKSKYRSVLLDMRLMNLLVL